jgi:hypothetical protein
MKKILLLLVLAASTAVATKAQIIDWSTENILGVDTIRSTDSGTPLPITMVMKNNGPDTAKVGDTVLFQFVITSGNNILLAYPNTTSLAIRVLTKNMNPSDTMHVALALAANSFVRTSGTVSIGAISHLINRPARNFEIAPGNTNNSIAKTIVWLNPQGWGVGLSELATAANSLKVFPNPTSDVLNLEMDYNKAATVTILDITGRQIATESFELGKASVNVNSYNKGIYLYQVTNEEGKVVKAGKFTVN